MGITYEFWGCNILCYLVHVSWKPTDLVPDLCLSLSLNGVKSHIHFVSKDL